MRNGIVNKIVKGENAGKTLKHFFVVSEIHSKKGEDNKAQF